MSCQHLQGRRHCHQTRQQLSIRNWHTTLFAASTLIVIVQIKMNKCLRFHCQLLHNLAMAAAIAGHCLVKERWEKIEVKREKSLPARICCLSCSQGSPPWFQTTGAWVLGSSWTHRSPPARLLRNTVRHTVWHVLLTKKVLFQISKKDNNCILYQVFIWVCVPSLQYLFSFLLHLPNFPAEEVVCCPCRATQSAPSLLLSSLSPDGGELLSHAGTVTFDAIDCPSLCPCIGRVGSCLITGDSQAVQPVQSGPWTIVMDGWMAGWMDGWMWFKPRTLPNKSSRCQASCIMSITPLYKATGAIAILRSPTKTTSS